MYKRLNNFGNEIVSVLRPYPSSAGIDTTTAHRTTLGDIKPSPGPISSPVLKNTPGVTVTGLSELGASVMDDKGDGNFLYFESFIAVGYYLLVVE